MRSPQAAFFKCCFVIDGQENRSLTGTLLRLISDQVLNCTFRLTRSDGCNSDTGRNSEFHLHSFSLAVLSAAHPHSTRFFFLTCSALITAAKCRHVQRSFHGGTRVRRLTRSAGPFTVSCRVRNDSIFMRGGNETAVLAGKMSMRGKCCWTLLRCLANYAPIF